jgi:hypothetical protein
MTTESAAITREHYDRLHERMGYLGDRIQIKGKRGWDNQYDISERDALAAALAVLSADGEEKHPPIPEGWRLVDKGKDSPKLVSDRFWRKGSSLKEWINNDSGGFINDDGKFYSEAIYIRRIEPPKPATPDPGEGWRIAEGEDWKDKRCEMWSGSRWEPRDEWHRGRMFASLKTYRVPIEPQYRPFANAEEFKPHAMRLWRWKVDSPDRYRMPRDFSDDGHNGSVWYLSFKNKCFDDGTPFGVKVTA